MKKRFNLNFIVFIILCLFTACSSENGEKEDDLDIQVADKTELTQTAYADERNTGRGVTFTAKSDWTATVAETTLTRTGGVSWLRLMHNGQEISSGKAGTFTLSIHLEANYTGAKRTATISLVGKEKPITITVEQEALTKEGETPKPEPSGSGTLKNEITGKTVNLVGMEHDLQGINSVCITFTGETTTVDGKEQAGEQFVAYFYNSLQDGKLNTGTYTIKNINEVELQKNGECGWIKSSLTSYGKEGTIKVEYTNNEYAFTFDIKSEDEQVLKGSFMGVPKYLNEEVKVESISLNEKTKMLKFGSSFTLEAIILPENATDKRYSWASNNTNIATVDEKGVVTAVATGSATITVTSTEGNKTATCEVTVSAPVEVESIKVEPAEITLLKGSYSESPINVTVMPENATNKAFTWKSDNESIADFDGKTVSGKEVGTAVITFITEDGAKTAKLKVTVQPRSTSGNGTITTSNSTGVLYNSDIISVKHTVLAKDEVKLEFVDDKGNDISQLTFYNPLTTGRLTSGNYAVLDHFNNITGTDRYGKVKSALWVRHPANPGAVWKWSYYYKSGNISVSTSGDTYTITFDNVQTNSNTDFETETITGSYTGKLVYENEYVEVNSVQLDKNTLSLDLSKSAQLTASVNPTNAFNKNITWSSSNSAIVTVSESGYLYAKAVGTATITVTTEDGAKTASCTVTVNALPTTGTGTFSNNNSQSMAVTRATYWINEKEPKELELAFYTATNSQLYFVLVRDNTDTGTLKAGTYSTISSLSSDALGVKSSYTNTGTATVTLSGDQYTITLDLTSGEGIKITGSYSGKLVTM